MEILEIAFIYLLSTLKFIFGPTLGYAAGLSLFTTIVITVLGMMTSVVLFTYMGSLLRDRVIRKLMRRRRTFSKKSRRMIRIWKKYGEWGVAALTPVIFTPIGGTVLLTSFGSRKKRILAYMLVSAIFWAIIISGVIYIFGPEVLPIKTTT